jgi:serine/threonine protein phosphatase 1
MLTIAIGDIHGMNEQLKRLLDKADKETKNEERQFVFIGDYMDRGPDSKGVLDTIRDLAKNEKVIPLMGNHDDMLLHDHQTWMGNGGRQTLLSFNPKYDMQTPFYEQERNPIQLFFEQFADYVEWIKALPLTHEDQHRFFCHAGIRPGVPLKEQQAQSLLWIRGPFLIDTQPFEKYIVHGHTVTPYDDLCPPEIDAGRPSTWKYLEFDNRLNLDSACVFGGPMSAAIFNDEQVKAVKFLTVDNKE